MLKKQINKNTVISVLFAGVVFLSLAGSLASLNQDEYQSLIFSQALYFCISAFAAIFLFLKKDISAKTRAVLCGLLSFCMIETLYGGSLGFNSWPQILIAAVSILFYASFFAAAEMIPAVKIRKAVQTALLCTVFIWSVINHYYYEYRGQSIQLSDLSAAGTALNVAERLSFAITPDIVLAVFCLASGLIAIRRSGPVSYRAGTAAEVLAFFALYFLSFFALVDIFTVKSWNTDAETAFIGYTFSFIQNAKEYLSDKAPEGYSAEYAESVLSEYEEEAASDDMAENIIVIMDESFSDLESVYGLSMNEDPLEYFHSLSGKNVRSGELVVSGYGGGTANTEYELLTGNSTAFLPDGTYAYTEYINDTQQSLASYFKDLGFTSIAFHPYLENGYKRNKVYSLMGFDNFFSLEDDLLYADALRGFITDSADIQTVISLCEETDGPLFIMNVTMQNHGNYNGALQSEIKYRISIEDEEYAEDEQLLEFVNLIDLSDDALKELITYFEESDEKTVVLFFGDHQPSLDAFSGKDSSLIYRVPYLLWANYDLEDLPEYELLSPWGLRELLLEAAGAGKSEYDAFLTEVMQQYPVISVSDGVYDAEGNHYSLDEALQIDIIKEYDILCWYNLRDRNSNFSLFSTSDS